ncbi:MAG: protein BatD [Bacteroidales bacterium]|nr:protein BatD [Bacteroidales bacterium]
MSHSRTIATIITTLFLALAATAAAQSSKITVRAPAAVEVGDQFQVTFEVNSNKVRDFGSPTFKGFSTLAGPSTYTSTNMSFVNGQSSVSHTTSYTFVLRADQEGSFNIGQAFCTVDGQRLSSDPFRIKVENSSGRNQRRQQQARQDPFADPFFDPFGGRPQQQQQPEPVKIDENSLFARASVDKTAPFRGQQMIVTYKIYTQVPISQFQIDKLPGNKGFWSEDLSDGKRIKQYEETVNGRRYQVAEIRRGALFAQDDGTLRIEPLDLDVLAMVQVQRRRTGTIFDLFDDNFFNPHQAVEKHLKTNPINIKVKSLPPAPDGFGGGVGSFSAKSRLSVGSIKANDAVTYSITISGSGNLMLIDEPSPAFPETFEVYDPKVTDNISRTDGGVSGSRTYEWILIPRSEGDYTIEPFEFVYFDPASSSYKTATTAAHDLHVDKGNANASLSGSQGKSDVKLINSDINHIHTATKLQPRSKLSGTPLSFWLLLAAIPVAAVIVVLAMRRSQRRHQDVVGMRRRRASRLARKRLRKADAHLRRNEAEPFYTEIYQAVWGVLSDKYSIPRAELNRESVQQCLADRHVDSAIVDDVMHTLSEVDFARFAPGDQSAHMKDIYQKALAMISKIE